MANVFDVAHYILVANGGKMSTVKLQKLCYYAQAWHLARHGVPLFPEEFEKWELGPVCRELYRIHRGQITIAAHSIPVELRTNDALSSDESGTVELVLDQYGDLEGDGLSKLTHEEDPWKSTEMDGVIQKDLMENYYFDRWGEAEDAASRDVVITDVDLNRRIAEMEATKGRPTYSSAAEMFKAILGHEVSSRVLY
jgi:uncharacterized phage-associated protein